MINRRNQLDKIIITAMDRFVWFVLLVVMSHLVTEFTRVTGYARGSRQDVVLINDSVLQPMPVQNMLYYPGQDYGLYEQSANLHANPHISNGNAPVIVAAGAAPANNEQSGGFLGFSFRPLIDSIFDIPISTLRAVNNLVARLTGSYQQAPTQKSASAGLVHGSTVDGVDMQKSAKKSLLREEIA